MSAVVAMAVFVGSHVVIARTQLRPMLIARFGKRTYLILYSTVSVLLLAWVIGTVLAADRILLWTAPGWSPTVAALGTLGAFILIGIGTVAPNPLSVAFRKDDFDPVRPGAIGWVRHPLILGFALWGLAHVPANGEWPGLVLFAGSAVFGVVGATIVDRRRKRQIGQEEWRRLTSGRGHLDQRTFVGAALGLVSWAIFLWIHPVLFNVDPLAALVAGTG
ncbi:MAG: NnrU family protein [Paracoccaceae bacterium]|nr:NnrU family protein [Paracoccaceae bacterium]